jgi:hypothetical protein
LCETTSVTWRFLQPFLKRFSRKPIYVPNLEHVTFSTVLEYCLSKPRGCGWAKAPRTRNWPTIVCTSSYCFKTAVYWLLLVKNKLLSRNEGRLRLGQEAFLCGLMYVSSIEAMLQANPKNVRVPIGRFNQLFWVHVS